MYGLAVGLGWTALTGGALSALTLGMPAALSAAPNGVGSALDTVIELQRMGYHVVLDRQGPAPLDRCTVDSVRPVPVDSQTVLLTARC